MPSIANRFFFLVASLLFLAPASVSAQPSQLAGIEAYIERGMADWRIPGLAVAVVRGDEVLYARGFGVRELGADAPVDEHTLFGVASTTKAMTAAALGLLIDEGRLHWDDRVVDYLPHFRTSDAWVTANVTIRDLLTHRVGLGRMTGNRLLFMPGRSAEEVMRHLGHLDFEQPFRQGYVYSNLMYMVAGEVVAAVSGQPWHEFVRDRLFVPLGMERSLATVEGLTERRNAARPHQEIDGEVVRIPIRDWGAAGPSAAANTSVSEMAQWMRLHLGEPGVYAGQRLIGRGTMREMHSPQVALPSPEPPGAIAAYGLGWRLDAHRGRRTLQHGGASDGMNTNLVLMPEEDLGVVVMTNVFSGFMNALTNEILDRMLGYDDTDWNARFLSGTAALRARAEAEREAIYAARTTDAPPRQRPSELAGAYHSDLYDDAVVRVEAGRLVLQLWGDDRAIADLEHWHHDTYRAIWRNRAMREEFVWFTTGREGRVDGMTIEFVLRPLFLQVGAYPSNYTRQVRYERASGR
jgi:CubicO group peptidase (beta-lactamase class C family)